MKSLGGVEQLVLGACIVCCGTLASFSLFVANLVVHGQQSAEQLAACGFLPAYLWTEAFLWCAILVCSAILVTCILTHGTNHNAYGYGGGDGANGITSWFCCTCSCGVGVGVVMVGAPYVMAALCWLHIGFGIGAGAWIGSHSEAVESCRLVSSPVYSLTVANIVLSMLFLVLPALVSSYFAYLNFPRVVEMCRRDYDFTAVNASDPDLDADIRGDGDGDGDGDADLHHRHGIGADGSDHGAVHHIDGDAFEPATIEHAAAAVARAGGLGMGMGDSHTPDIDLALSAAATPTLQPQHSAAGGAGAAFDGGSIFTGPAGSAGGSGYPAAHYDAHPDDLALGYSHGERAAASAADISGVVSPAIGPAATAGVAYHSIESASLNLGAARDSNDAL